MSYGAFEIAGATANMAVNASLDKKNRQFVNEQNELNRQFAHNEASLAWQRQLEMTDKVNAWNSYSNQRKLLQSAGYNPNALFNSSSTLSASNGGSTAPQASTPSTFNYPAFRLDPISFSDIALKMSQAKNIDADTLKKNQETYGQELQNSFQEIANGIYKDYGRFEKELDLDVKDSQRAFNDANRILVGTQQSLNLDELVSMRPREAYKLVTESVANQSQDLLNKAVAAKTDEERDMLVKNYILASFVASATYAKSMSEARWNNLQSDLWEPDKRTWSPKGVLFRSAFVDSNQKYFDYKLDVQRNKDFYDVWRESVWSALRANQLYNDNIRSLIDSNTWFRINLGISKIPWFNGGSNLIQPNGLIPYP